MKKRDLKKLALLGMLSGVVLSQNVQAADTKNNKSHIADSTETKSDKKDSKSVSPDDYSNFIDRPYTEEELLSELNDDGKKLYNSLDKQGKKLAVETAGKYCTGTNECAGLNACKTDKNDCAGKGACKGQGKCAISDKNQAVKFVDIKMKKQRAKASGH